MSLSLSMTRILLFDSPALFRASKAIPAVIAPSPIIAIDLLLDLFLSIASEIPRATDIEVLECPVPK